MTIAGLMANGSGSRIATLGRKPFIKVGGRPLVSWVLDQFKEAGVSRLVVSCRQEDHELQTFLSEYRGIDAVRFTFPTGGGTGSSVRAILNELTDEACLISTVDTIAPLGSMKRLREFGEATSGCVMAVMATTFVHDVEPIWMHSANGKELSRLGKNIPPSCYVYGNSRWMSREAVEFLRNIEPPVDHFERDVVLMSKVIDEFPERVRIYVEDPIVDVDDPSDVAVAESLLSGDSK